MKSWLLGRLVFTLEAAGGVALVLAGANAQTRLTVIDPTPGATVLRAELTQLDMRSVTIGGAAWTELDVSGEGYVDEVGSPRLPRICRSVVVPADRDVTASVVWMRYHDVENFDAAPARGPISRTQDPASVPYVFGPRYAQAGFYPAEPVSVREPFVMRDVRGVVVEINCVQYDSVARVLRVIDEIVVSLDDSGPASSNALPPGAAARRDREFQKLFRRQFLNWVEPEPVPFVESGGMLVIAHSAFVSAMQPFAAWKNSAGIPTTIVDVATIGNDATAIKAHIQGVYAAGNLSYVLLVGDAAEIASGSYAGGSSDPYYSNMTADLYPDLMVGRFSASTVAQVQTQVERSIEYEQMDHSLALGGWNARAMGIASDQGPGHYGEYDNQHMELIRQDLLAYGMTSVDQIYDPTGTKAMVKSGLENGRRFVDYCGHGSDTSWGSTGWSNADIATLANDNLLPVIHSVACVNGNFAAGTCFGEAWLRSTRNGEPIGAVGAYMSSINQYWNEPMYAQDETVDCMRAEAYWSMGALWFAGSCKMMDLMGASGQDMFMTWICFGDPSLRVFGDPGCPLPSAYCTTSTTTNGCGPLMSAIGQPTAGGTAPFTLRTDNVEGQRTGLMFYGVSGATLMTWHINSTSLLCVAPPRQRTTLSSSGGTAGLCNGALALDWNAYVAANPTALGVPFAAGDEFWVQAWFRDPPAATGTNLSNALHCIVCP
jgi:gingipain R